MRFLKFLMFSLMVLSSISLYGKETKIVMTGSTTVLPIAQRIAEVYMSMYPDVVISVRGGGSGVGITALLEGRTDIATSSRKIKDEEIKTGREKGIFIKEIEIAKDGIVIIVNKNNPVSNITIDELKKIYTGEITNWNKLGGPNQPIVVISRDLSSGTFEVFKEIVLKNAKMSENCLMLASNNAVSSTVSTTPWAIGYVGLGYITEDVKPLTLNNVIPSEKTVRDGTYKLSRSLYFYLNGEPKGEINKFIEFTLSETGQKLVKESGFIPLK
uniref:Phosphate-binding protein n=1 Tax=candidate division WOR-3 bacterium TaxID=2052148 RepID=A0A7C4YB08_UNCW3